MPDYFGTVKNFSAADLERRVLAGSLSDGVNACVECCDRWAKDGAIALEWYGANGERRTLTFAEMRDNAAKFANYLKSHGIGRGDVVAGLLPRVPDLFTVILGAWRVGAMYQPLFTAFGRSAAEDGERQDPAIHSARRGVKYPTLWRRTLLEVGYCRFPKLRRNNPSRDIPEYLLNLI